MFCDKCEIADDAIMYFVVINVVVIEDNKMFNVLKNAFKKSNATNTSLL